MVMGETSDKSSNFDVGIERMIFDELICKEILKDRLGSADAKGAFGALLELGEAALHPVQKLKGARNVLKHKFAPLLRELHALMHAVEERRAELIF